MKGADLQRQHRGQPSGFELIYALGESLPLTLFGLRDGNSTMQLNATFTPWKQLAPNQTNAPVAVRYAGHDYPTMVLYSARSGRPVAPFELNLTEAYQALHERPRLVLTSDAVIHAEVAARDSHAEPYVSTGCNATGNDWAACRAALIADAFGSDADQAWPHLSSASTTPRYRRAW